MTDELQDFLNKLDEDFQNYLLSTRSPAETFSKVASKIQEIKSLMASIEDVREQERNLFKRYLKSIDKLIKEYQEVEDIAKDAYDGFTQSLYSAQKAGLITAKNLAENFYADAKGN